MNVFSTAMNYNASLLCICFRLAIVQVVQRAATSRASQGREAQSQTQKTTLSSVPRVFLPRRINRDS